MTTVQILTTDLRAEAAAEVLRLTASRRFAGDADEAALGDLEGDGPWMTSARGTRRRRALRRRVLLVWRMACEDGSGGLVESCLVPVVIELSAVPARSRRRAWTTALLCDADVEMRAQIEAASADWREAVERSVQAFAATRASRERAMAARAIEIGDRAFQPGLFDRRAERMRGCHASAVAEADRAAADRLAAIEQRAATAPGPPRLLLALLP
jgi:hypothetical protein